MREIWDEERKLKKEKREKEQYFRSVAQSASWRRTAARKRAEQLTKIRKYYLEHLELKKVALDFFPEYEKYLGEAGFLKV